MLGSQRQPASQASKNQHIPRPAVARPRTAGAPTHRPAHSDARVPAIATIAPQQVACAAPAPGRASGRPHGKSCQASAPVCASSAAVRGARSRPGSGPAQRRSAVLVSASLKHASAAAVGGDKKFRPIPNSSAAPPASRAASQQRQAARPAAPSVAAGVNSWAKPPGMRVRRHLRCAHGRAGIHKHLSRSRKTTCPLLFVAERRTANRPGSWISWHEQDQDQAPRPASRRARSAGSRSECPSHRADRPPIAPAMRHAGQAHEADGQAGHDAGQRLGQQDLPDDLPRGWPPWLGPPRSSPASTSRSAVSTRRAHKGLGQRPAARSPQQCNRRADNQPRERIMATSKMMKGVERTAFTSQPTTRLSKPFSKTPPRSVRRKEHAQRNTDQKRPQHRRRPPSARSPQRGGKQFQHHLAKIFQTSSARPSVLIADRCTPLPCSASMAASTRCSSAADVDAEKAKSLH
ncbi:hypothetical protein FQR65_LT20437 [Abscondita terminalis]|nr:hypothetical protein FQR65_LT20437 [Abscondita terminalis]